MSNDIKLAYSTLACPGWTVEQAAQAARTYGYDGIEWRLADGEVITPQIATSLRSRIIAATDKYELEVACLDTSCKFVQPTEEARQQVVQEAIAMADLAAELGAAGIRVFGGNIPAGMSRPEILAPTILALKQAASYCAEKGVKLLVETHDDWSNSSDAFLLAQELLLEQSGAILWDVHHPYRMGETPSQTLHNLLDGRAVSHIHVKDARQIPSTKDPLNPEQEIKWQLTLLGEGEIPLREIVQLLKQRSYTGYLSLEWEKKWHPEIEEPEIALPHALARLREYLG